MPNPKPSGTMIRCSQCQYEGPAKTNNKLMFMGFMVLFFSGWVYTPLLVVALVYFGWLLARPSKFACPSCKSKDVVKLEDIGEPTKSG